MHPFASERARTRLQAAADGVERESSIELVVAVRPYSVDLLAADLIGGALASFAVLLFTLFAPPEFSLLAIALATVASFVVGALAVRSMPGLRRLPLGELELRDGVRRGARACFVELGIHATRGRTGVLVYVSLAENRVAVVADLGVQAAASDALARFVAFAEGVPEENGLDEVAVERLVAAIEAFGAAARHCLPRTADDVDELGEWQ